MLWLTHNLGDREEAVELVTNFAVFKGFGNTPTLSINDRPMEGTVTNAVVLIEHIKDLLRENKTVFRSLDELHGFSLSPKTTR